MGVGAVLVAAGSGGGGGGSGPQPGFDGKTKRVIKWGPLSVMADCAAKVLIDAGVPFYQRGQSLVRPVTVPVQSFHGKTANAAQLVEVELPYLRDTLCQNSCWVKYDGRSRKWKDIHPPVEAAQVLLEAVWRLELSGDRRDHLDADAAPGRHDPVQAAATIQRRSCC